MLIHTVFDFAGWLTAAVVGVVIARMGLLGAGKGRTPMSDPGYFIALGVGALIGAILFGSLNLNFAGIFALGHSIAGGIAGGIVAVELYKWARGISGSTGIAFAAPLAAGIAVGRLGGFYLFVLVYGTQRFAWEFLKPYPTLLGPFNVFHLVTLAMIAYALVMILGPMHGDMLREDRLKP
jgi:phosphatidylglycerol:prolipoprotein diacylglycerol transferase